MARRSKLPGMIAAATGAPDDDAVAEDEDTTPPATKPVREAPAAETLVGTRVRYSEIRGSMLLDVVARVLAEDGGILTVQIPDNFGQPGEIITATPYDAAARRGWWKA